MSGTAAVTATAARRPLGGRLRLAAGIAAAALLTACGADGSEGRAAHEPERPRNEVVAESRLSHLPAFSAYPFADDLKREQDEFDRAGKPDSEYGRVTPDFEGTYTNVRDGRRRTLHLKCEGCPRRTVWFVGGSAAFGLGQRDDYTIASQLVRAAKADGVDLRVANMGTPGSTLVEELAVIEAHLRVDDDRPDLVVFYDGFNDVLATYMYAIVNDGALPDVVTFKGEFAQTYIEMTPTPVLDDRHIPAVIDKVNGAYRETRDRAVERLASDGIAAEFFFQPDAFVSEIQLESLAQSLNLTMAELSTQRDLPQIMEGVSSALEPDVHNLRPLMEPLDEPVFADPAHMNERGAEIVAGAMWGRIRDALALPARR